MMLWITIYFFVTMTMTFDDRMVNFLGTMKCI
jgi:hypothetical protein